MKEIIIDTRAYPVPIPLQNRETNQRDDLYIYRILEPGEVAVKKENPEVFAGHKAGSYLSAYAVEHLSAMIDNLREQYPLPSLKDMQTISRDDLEYMVAQCVGNGIITMSKGRHLLGFRYMEQMREWYNTQALKEQNDG